MMEIREKLYSLIDESGACFNCFPCEDYEKEEKYKIVDHLIANNVKVQKYAYLEQVLDYGFGNCYGRCSNCHTQHKANSYSALMMEHIYCKWCGAKLLYNPLKGE